MIQFWKFLKWIFIIKVTSGYPQYTKPNVPTQNMNGEYLISNPNNDGGKSFSTLYSTYPNIEYFDVYSPPISTRYNQYIYYILQNVFNFDKYYIT